VNFRSCRHDARRLNWLTAYRAQIYSSSHSSALPPATQSSATTRLSFHMISQSQSTSTGFAGLVQYTRRFSSLHAAPFRNGSRATSAYVLHNSNHSRRRPSAYKNDFTNQVLRMPLIVSADICSCGGRHRWLHCKRRRKRSSCPRITTRQRDRTEERLGSSQQHGTVAAASETDQPQSHRPP
jgi:hypothetical protein